MLVHIKELFKKGVAGTFAYPAFNTQNLETTIRIVQAAEESGVPVMILGSSGSVLASVLADPPGWPISG